MGQGRSTSASIGSVGALGNGAARTGAPTMAAATVTTRINEARRKDRLLMIAAW